MSTDKIKITVDDKEIEAVAGSMLIEVADKIGIHIPRFCYHKKLSVSANCRMCLVEVEKAPKPMPACATPVNEGMVVWTRSEKALAAQKDTMEFLLINHPLDCPICDQGGECELQDLSMASGGSSSHYQEIKRVVADKDIGELVSTEMTRCIQCTRCVRFGEEIAGLRELGAMGRGDRMEIGTFVEQSLSSELSGNIIDICPVGALTAKPSRYTARSWEMMQAPGIASHDCVGSTVNLHTFRHKLVRVVAGDNEAVNECWISDRDRFSYQGVYAKDRTKTPLIKHNGIWKEASWDEAFEKVADSLKAVSPNDVGVLASPRATIEELYLLQKGMRAIGVNNIDHRLRQTDFRDQESMGLFPWLGIEIAELEKQDAVFLIGSNVRKEQPMINHRLRTAALKNNASIMSVNTYELDFNYGLKSQLVSAPNDFINTLAIIAKAALKLSGNKVPAGLSDLLKSVRVNNDAKEVVEELSKAEKAIVFVGSFSVQHPNFSIIRALASVISDSSNAILSYLPESANTAGAWLAGATPHRKEAGEASQVIGENTAQMLDKSLKAYVLLDVEPVFDCDNPEQAQSSIRNADCVIAITPFAHDSLLECANIILPSAVFGETSGTYVNAEGRWQSFQAAAKGFEQSRPAWKILRVLGNVLGVDGFDYVSSTDVRDELKQACEAVSPVSNVFEILSVYEADSKQTDNSGLIQRIGVVAEFSGDSLQRRATALQNSSPQQNALHLSAESIESLGLKLLDNNLKVIVEQDGKSVSVSLMENNAVPSGCALLYSGTQISSKLGSAFGFLKITV